MNEVKGRVSVVVRRRVEAGCESAYEELLKGLLTDAEKFKGYRGSEVIRPSLTKDDYDIKVHFDSNHTLRAWVNSKERLRWLDAMNRLADEPQISVLSGLEIWFTVPAQKHAGPPHRHKMMVLTWLAIYPSVLLFSLLVEQLPYALHPVVSVFFVTVMVVPTATYILLPRFTRLFESWLFV